MRKQLDLDVPGQSCAEKMCTAGTPLRRVDLSPFVPAQPAEASKVRLGQRPAQHIQSKKKIDFWRNMMESLIA
jgi:hypothetical protein